MAKPQIDKTLTALAGEFLVAGRLCAKGYLASLTLKHYPQVDIFCLNPKNGKEAAIQVKTVRGSGHCFVPENIDDCDHPYVFVWIHDDESEDYFIVPSSTVASITAAERNKYIKEHPGVSKHQPRMFNVSKHPEFKNCWDLLALE